MTVMPLAVIAAVVVAASAWGAVGLLLLLAIAGAGVYFAWRRIQSRQRELEEEDLPPLLYPVGSANRPPPAARSPMSVTAAPGPQATSAPVAPGYPPAAAAPSRMPPAFADTELIAEVAGEPVRVAQVHFHRPPEGTLQLLPGRLEILAGSERIDEIRFLKVPGREPAVTFGRSPGEPHLHVQLDAPTVSRLHARMSYQAGRWRIANLSRTNPILVNGEQLPLDTDAWAVLEDGDCVEMGQVIFRFRTR